MRCAGCGSTGMTSGSEGWMACGEESKELRLQEQDCRGMQSKAGQRAESGGLNWQSRGTCMAQGSRAPLPRPPRTFGQPMGVPAAVVLKASSGVYPVPQPHAARKAEKVHSLTLTPHRASRHSGFSLASKSPHSFMLQHHQHCHHHYRHRRTWVPEQGLGYGRV